MNISDFTPEELRIAMGRYRSHKESAIYNRKIEFNLTFDEWITIWLQSGHWLERGTRGNQYCMSRFNDSGSYSVGNVEIKTNSENIKEGQLKRVGTYAASGKRISATKKGVDLTSDHRKALSIAKKGRTDLYDHCQHTCIYCGKQGNPGPIAMHTRYCKYASNEHQKIS